MRNQIILAVILSACATGTAFAQAAQAGRTGAMASPNAQGVQIQGNTEIKAKQDDVKAVAKGQGNEAKNTAGAIKGGTQIQGNTKIDAKQKNASAKAEGKNNKASNQAGTIGGN